MRSPVDLSAAIKNALPQIEAILGNQSFVYDGETIPCTCGQLSQLTALEYGGLDESITIVLQVRKEAFTDGIIPTEDERVTFRNRVYSIDKLDTDNTDTVLNLYLKK